MATKKKAAAKKKAPARKPSGRGAKPAAPVAAPAPALVQPEGNGLLKGFLALVAVMVVLALVMAHRSRTKAATAAALVTTPAAAPTPATPELPAIQSEGPHASGMPHRGDAGATVKKPKHLKKAVAAAPEQPAPKAIPTHAGSAAPVAKAAASIDNSDLHLSKNRTLTLWAYRSEDDSASLDVFGARNKVMAHITSAAGPAGKVKLTWDGKDSDGDAVAPGRYYVRASSKGPETLRRLNVEP